MTNTIYTLLAALFCFNLGTIGAQENSSTPQNLASIMPTPSNKWEIGIGVGHAMINGDIDFKPGFGAGLHFRKALDYIFSIRGDIAFASYNGEASTTREDGVQDYNASSISGALHGVMTLNNMRWTQGERNNNIYIFGGAGLANISPEATVNGSAIDPFEENKIDNSTTSFAGRRCRHCF